VSALFLLEKANGSPPGTTLHIQSSGLRQVFAIEIVELDPPVIDAGEVRRQVLPDVSALDQSVRRNENREISGPSKELIILGG